MTPSHDPDLPSMDENASALDSLGFDVDDIDGHTLDELTDYLDRGRVPADPTIDASPSSQMALADLERLRTLTQMMRDHDAAAQPDPDESWVNRIMSTITTEARAGRTIPLRSTDPAAGLAITEGAVRNLLRSAGDSVGDVIVGRCTLEGDVTTLDTPITAHIEVSAAWGQSLQDIADLVRDRASTTLTHHTDLVLEAIDVTIRDLRVPPGTDPVLP